MWRAFDTGKSIGKKGSESGRIVADEEHDDGARVTLERDGCTAPWSITCGIYGSFMHTAFASSEEEGRKKYSEMKSELVTIMKEDSSDSRYEKMRRFAEVY